MNGNDTSEPIHILLSREELLFVLNLLQAGFIPGLDNDPLGELTAEQQALALTIAGRALWARELAQLHPDGQWVVHNNLFLAVGGCAYAQSVISVFHWPANGALPRRFFGHLRENHIVIHTRPADVLHRFSLLSSREQLISQVLTACDLEDGSAAPPQELTVLSDDFVKLRELAGAGDTTEAVKMLASNGTLPETAQAFVSTLADSARVSILQILHQPVNGAVQKRDFTVLQNSQQTWLISAPTSDTDDALLSVKTTTRGEVTTLLSEWL